jgi:general secretion pathway protein J
MKNDAQGFTLLEVMIALILLTLLATMAYRGLDAVLQAEARGRQEIERWRALNQALGHLENDLINAIELSGDPRLGPTLGMRIASEGRVVSWWRMLPEDRDGGTQRVAYEYGDGNLERLVWPPWSPTTEAARRATLLSGLRAWRARALDEQGAWRDAWPVAGQPGLPRAIELRFETAFGAELRRVIKLR